MDARRDLPSMMSDLVVASYSLGEMAECETVVEKLWGMTQKVLIVVEPGTPKGFERLKSIRKQLLNGGAHLIAPCPHSNMCPLSEGDWCHFYARLNRSSLHRRAKEAHLSYEDEKFSYLIFAKEPVDLCAARVLRHPHKGKGHVRLTLCTSQGIKEKVVTKKDKEEYRLAKKSDWGDIVI
jgi:ribosomal protein RSM22 (predicted rRNA methylase)